MMSHGGETVYGSDLEVENIGLSSERVQGLATSIYKEFERMIARYDEDVVKELMPLVVTILENLDQTMTDYNESAVEIELLKDDKEQLKTQFERERQLRRQAEQRLMENEDVQELATRDLRNRAEELEGITRQLKMRCKNHADQVERLQERESELKKEYNELHQRHTEMIQSYVEHIEKTKVFQQQMSAPELSKSPKQKKERPKVLETISPLTPSTPQSPGPSSLKQMTPQTPHSHLRGLTSTPDFERSHTSIKDEMPKSPLESNSAETKISEHTAEVYSSHENQDSKPHKREEEIIAANNSWNKNNTSTPLSGASVDRKNQAELQNVLTSSPLDKQHSSYKTDKKKASTHESQELVNANQLPENPPYAATVSQTGVNNVTEVQKLPRKHEIGTVAGRERNCVTNESPQVSSKGEMGNEAGDWLSSEVQGMLELGPDIYSPEACAGDTLHGLADKSVERTGIENEAFEHTVNVNENSLFAEMSKQDLGDVDDGADILGMGKEVENLIHENTKLLATKNALNVVKDDLIHQVDQLTTQLTMLQEELEKSQQAKESLYSRVSELESELSKMRKKMTEMENNTTNHVMKNSEEDESIPMSQRKRFTRVEMARVLMERNQYKERLMELQEAVRWTEMLRASRDHPELNPQNKNKNKSSIFQFFSRLFSSGNSASSSAGASTSPNCTSPNVSRRRSGTVSSDINIGYNVPSSKVIPKSRSGNISLYGRSPTLEAVQDTGTLLKHEAKKGGESSMLNDPGRIQACGWSLPGAIAAPQEKSRTVPVPVYCIPMLDANVSSKLWCAAAVNISIGKTRDGGSIVGTGSVFYSQVTVGSEMSENCTSVKSSSRSSIDKLDEELEIQKRDMEKETSRREALSSLVWLVSSDTRSGHNACAGTKVRVIDARDPSRVLESFLVGSIDANILCITSVPGVQEEDYSNVEDVELDPSNISQNDSSPMMGVPVTCPPPSSFPNVAEELATEMTEETKHPTNDSLTVTVMEHVFTDPLGVQLDSMPPSGLPISQAPENHSTELIKTGLDGASDGNLSVGSPMYGTLQVVQSPSTGEDPSSKDMSQSFLTTSQAEMGFTKVDPATSERRLASLQPTMWMGSQNGCLYVHSAMSDWSQCLHQIRLKDSVLAIVHIRGRALAALADGTVAIFRRNNEGYWDLSNYHLLDLGRPHHSIRCMAVVYEKVWCGYRNKIRVIDPKTMKIETTFNAHPRHESQVRGLAWAGDGVWMSIRLDSTLRLYHARTLQHLQDVDVEPYVSKVLGTGKLGFSFVRITALIASSNRLWIGTGNGVVISVPLSESSKSAVGLRISSSTSTSATSSIQGPGGVVRVYSDPMSEKVTPGTYIPYCSMANAQLSFHGHRDAVKFFVAVPGCVTQAKENLDAEGKKGNPPSAFSIAAYGANTSSLVMSGGEGYIDFRHCDGGTSPQQETPLQAKSSPNLTGLGVGTQNHSHIIVWQLTPAKVA